MLKMRALALATVAVAMCATQIWAQSDDDFEQDERVNISVADSEEGQTVRVLRTPTFTDLEDYISGIWELHTEGLELTPFIRALVEQEGGNVRAWNYWDEERNPHYFIQVVAVPYQMPYVEELIDTYNRPGMISHVGGIRRHLRLRNRLASDIADILNNGVVTGEGFARADDSTNTLFIVDSLSDGNRDVNVAMYYDVPPRMVELGLQIFEIDVSDRQQLGLDWDAWKTSLSGFAQLTSASGDGLGGDFISFDSLLNIDATALAEFLNYLVNNGRGDVLTNTNLTAINGQEAIFESSRHIQDLQYVQRFSSDPLLVVTDTSDSDAQRELRIGNRGGSVSYREDLRDVGLESEGIVLTFVPTIGTDRMTADVDCTVNSLVNQNDLDQPIVATRRVQTVITLEDNQMVLLGSFDRQTQLNVENGIPGLRSIPWIGRTLFQETTTELRETKLVVLVTPQIDEHIIYDNIQLDYGKQIQGPAYYPYATNGVQQLQPWEQETIDQFED